MTSTCIRTLGGLVAALLMTWASVVPSPALAQPDPAQQRARIAAERAQADAVFADRERACLPQFVVAPCREAARKEQRATLTRLRREEVALDEAERNASAARRREGLAGKAGARQSRIAAADASAAQRAQAQAVAPGVDSAASASKERAERAPRATPSPRGHADDAGRRSALEARNIAAFEARARAARAHREAVAQRTARRLQGSDGDRGHQGTQAARRSAPLPMPLPPVAAASAPVAPVPASRPAR